MRRKIVRLARKLLSGKRKYSGIVTGKEYAVVKPHNGRVTLYTIKTDGGKNPVVRCSIRGDSKSYDNSMNPEDRVEITLGGACATYTSISTRENARKKARDGSTSIISRKFDWPAVMSYKILERRVDEEAENTAPPDQEYSATEGEQTR